VLIVLGTRPEAIKLAPVIRALRASDRFEAVVCATGQHREMLDQVLRVFAIDVDHDLDVMQPNQTLPNLTGQLLQRVTSVITEVEPDIVMVQGDTTTAMAAAMAAFYARVPVAHLEAGLRSDDMRSPWPEEMNRRVVTIVTGLHLAPTERARTRLLAEGVADTDVVVTGNTVIDALLQTVEAIDRHAEFEADLAGHFPALDPSRRLILVTSHRRENWGNGLRNICDAIVRVSEGHDVDVLYPVHLNPNVKDAVMRLLGGRPRVHLTAPLGYLDFVWALRRCHLVVTDSGGVQEEAPSLGKPVLVVRDTTERPEGIEAGVARLVGTDADAITAAVHELLVDEERYRAMARRANPYGDGLASRRIVDDLATWVARQGIAFTDRVGAGPGARG
jgi:UDP-N-acetylglucosamine 2-epimerase